MKNNCGCQQKEHQPCVEMRHLIFISFFFVFSMRLACVCFAFLFLFSWKMLFFRRSHIFHLYFPLTKWNWIRQGINFSFFLYKKIFFFFSILWLLLYCSRLFFFFLFLDIYDRSRIHCACCMCVICVWENQYFLFESSLNHQKEIFLFLWVSVTKATVSVI